MATQPLAAHPPGNAARQAAGGPRYEPLGSARTLLVVLYLIVAAWYLAWRPSTFNPGAMTFSVVLYAAELFGFLTALMHIFMVWRLSVREAPAAPAGLGVDVFVTTWDEPVSMLRRTLLAAINMDYAHTTWLLDDGNRPRMRALASELSCRYLSRDDNAHAKAGNLNHALRHSNAEFVAVFDADHAPAREFLRRTLGYFHDPNLGFVQTPQDFYNLDSYQHRRHSRRRLVWTEQSLFFRVIQRGKDYWNAAFFCGSCAVLRRRALSEIGGIATGTVTEDLETSIRLHRKGFKSAYHAESLAFGLAPNNVVPFLKQRVRWGQGAMQALRGGGILFRHGLTPAQRICYLATVVTYFDGWQKAVFYLSPVIVLTTGVMPIAELSWELLVRFLPFYALTFWVFEEVGRGYGRSVNIEQYNMARFAAFVWSTTGIVRRNLRFGVTPKLGADAQLSRRWVLPQALVFLLNVTAIPLGIFVTWRMGRLPTGALVANVVWAALNASLAQAVLGFSARLASFQRREYRFPVPLPAQLEFSGAQPVIGVLDDISSQGFKFYGRFPDAVQTGTHFAGELYLPSGPLRFQARVRTFFRAADSVQHVKSLGCSFQWDLEADRDQLDVFLYGSDLQWRLNRLGEQARTPMDWMARTPVWHEGAKLAPAERWASALVQPLAGPFPASHLSLVSVPRNGTAERTLITFRELHSEQTLRAAIITRSGQQTLEGPAQFVERLGNSDAPLHVYRFRPELSADVPRDEPR